MDDIIYNEIKEILVFIPTYILLSVFIAFYLDRQHNPRKRWKHAQNYCLEMTINRAIPTGLFSGDKLQ